MAAAQVFSLLLLYQGSAFVSESCQTARFYLENATVLPEKNNNPVLFHFSFFMTEPCMKHHLLLIFSFKNTLNFAI